MSLSYPDCLREHLPDQRLELNYFPVAGFLENLPGLNLPLVDGRPRPLMLTLGPCWNLSKGSAQTPLAPALLEQQRQDQTGPWSDGGWAREW